MFLSLSIYLGVSYSSYALLKDEEDLSFIETNEIVSINYLNGKEYNYKNIMPHDVITKKISITNVSDNNTFVTLSLMDIEKSSEGLVLKVLDGNNNVLYEEKITDIDTELVKTNDLGSGKTVSYTIIIENVSDKAIDFFNANILTYSELSKSDSKKIKDTILENNLIMNYSHTGVGKDTARENEGLIKTNDDLGEAYYFRGKVDNNYVNFAGYNFRILRINGDGTVRIILLDPLEGLYAYNSNVDEVDDYTTKLVLDNATINEKLNNWLDTNLNDYSKYIATSSFCNDTTISLEEDDSSYFLNYNRIMLDDNPTLECTNPIKAKIGLVTADEVEFAGGYKDKINTDYFLYNGSINSGWWTMSGSKIMKSNNSAAAFIVMPNGSLSNDKKVTMEFAIRPVISIDKNTIVTGTGTAQDPYIVKK